MSQKSLAKLTPADIRAFITARRQEGLGPGGVQRALAAVRSFYKFLAKEGVLAEVKVRSIRNGIQFCVPPQPSDPLAPLA